MNSMISQIILNNMLEFIEVRGLRKTWVAERMGISKQRLNSLFKKAPSFDEVYNLAAVLGQDIQYFMREDFKVEPEIPDYQWGLPDSVLFCGNCTDTTREALALVGELVEVLHIFKRNNI